MALIGTISGSNGTSITAISGSLLIADEPLSRFPALKSGVKLFISGAKSTIGADAPSAIFGGDTFISGAFGTDSYIQMKPVGALAIPTNTTASYIYTSGSTNDLYFTQYQPGTGYTNTTRLRWLEGGLSTGLLSGGTLSSTSGSTTYDILSGSGLIVTYNAHGAGSPAANEPYPTITRVSWPTLTGRTLPSISTTQITYVAMDSTGSPFLKSVPFVNGEYNEYIVLGRILHTDKAGTNGAVNQPTVCYGLNQFRGDFARAFGPIKLSGHTFYGSGSTGLKKDGGDSYAEGRNYTVDPDNPNYVSSTTDTAQPNSKIFYEYVNAAGDDVIANNGNLGYTALDFGNYNNAGTLTTVGAGNKFTIQRVFWFPNAVNRAFYVYYGNKIYATLDDAQAGISSEVFTEGKNTRDSSVFLGYVIVKGVGLDFADPTTYRIVQAGSFRAVATSGAGATGTPGGANTYVQFNDSSVFNGTNDFRFDKAAGRVLVANLVVTGTTAGSLVSSGTFQVKDTAGAIVGSISNLGVISGSGDLQVGGNITGSNLYLAGDIAVFGGDLTSTAATFNLANSGVSTVNFGQGASAVNIGSGSSVVAIGQDLNIAGGGNKLRFGPSQNLTMLHNTNAAITNTAGQFLVQQQSVNNRLEFHTSGTTAAGMFRLRNFTTNSSTFRDLMEVRNDGTILIGSATVGPTGLGSTTISNDLFLSTGIIAVNTDTTPIQLVSSGNVTIKLDANGNAPGHFFAIQNNNGIDQFRVGEDGDSIMSGSLLVSGAAINTATTTTFNLLNSTLTGTLNVGGQATLLFFGSNTSTGTMAGDFGVNGRTGLGGVVERMTHVQSPGASTQSFNLIAQSIFYVNNPTGGIAANFTNLPLTTNRVYTPTVIFSQSATPQTITKVQIDGVDQTINWANNVTPTANGNKQDVFGFSLIRSGTAWKVLGQMSTYG